LRAKLYQAAVDLLGPRDAARVTAPATPTA
jgi:hypothetical protein